MLSLKFVRWLLGYVTFTIFYTSGKDGASERFLNLAARMGVSLWNLKKLEGKFNVCTGVRQYHDLRGPARKAGVRLKILKKKGFPFFLKRCGRRKGLFAGAAVFLIILYAMPLFIWSVDVKGNVAIPAGEIRAAASELGLEPGLLKSNLEPLILQQKLMLKFPDVSWMTVNTHGSTATILLEEKVKHPDIIDLSKVCNVKASRTGQVISIETYTGEAQVKAGDAVIEGQLLISGVMEDAFGGTLLKHATGRVIAETSRTVSVEIPIKQKIATSTGKTVVRRSLDFFGLRIPLTIVGEPRGNYKRETKIEPLKSGDTTLPVSIFTENWTEQEEQEITVTQEQAKLQALKKLEEFKITELKDVKVISEKQKEEVKKEVYQLTVVFSCEENIAVESEILLR